MTRTEQRKFARDLIRHVRTKVMSRANQWPKEWDGHELRELLAEAFRQERSTLMMRDNAKRRRAAENEMIVRKLV